MGPVDTVGDRAVGPTGSAAATRMNEFRETMLAKTGLLAMTGKAEREPAATEVIRNHRATYLVAVDTAVLPLRNGSDSRMPCGEYARHRCSRS